LTKINRAFKEPQKLPLIISREEVKRPLLMAGIADAEAGLSQMQRKPRMSSAVAVSGGSFRNAAKRLQRLDDSKPLVWSRCTRAPNAASKH
jgi:hypothetical protein